MPTPPIPLSHLTGAPDPERKYRLLELVRHRMRELRYRPRTIQAYVCWIRRYVLFHQRRHPRDLGTDDVRRFLSSLARERKVAASTQNQALAALTLLYDRVLLQPLERVDGVSPARRTRHVPVVLSPREVRSILARLEEPARLCVTLMYGGGLRIGECLALRVKGRGSPPPRDHRSRREGRQGSSDTPRRFLSLGADAVASWSGTRIRTRSASSRRDDGPVGRAAAHLSERRARMAMAVRLSVVSDRA